MKKRRKFKANDLVKVKIEVFGRVAYDEERTTRVIVWIGDSTNQMCACAYPDEVELVQKHNEGVCY